MSGCAPAIAVRVPDGHTLTLSEFTEAAATVMGARWGLPPDRVVPFIPEVGWYARWWAHVHEAATHGVFIPGAVLAELNMLDVAHIHRVHRVALVA